MISLNVNPNSGAGGGLRLLAYLPFVKMKNNRAVGLSKRADDTTAADGTLYPVDLNTSNNIGALNSFVAQMAGYLLETTDDETPGNNVTKMLVGENYFQKYKRFKYASIRIAKKWRQNISNISVDTNSIPHKFVELDANRGIIFFKVAGSGYYVQAIERDPTTNVIILGTPLQIETNNNSTDPFYLDAVLINTNKVLFVQASTGNARVVSVSGLVCTLGTAVSYTGGGSAVTLAYLDTDKAVVAYNETSDGRIRVITVSGTTVTVNTVAAFGEGQNCDNPYVVPNTTTKTQVTYSVGNQQKTRVISISGTTCTPETAINVGAAGEYLTLKGMFHKIATDKWILMSAQAKTKAWIITASGTTSSATSSNLANAIGYSRWNSFIEVTAGSVYLFYQISDDSSLRKVRKITISGTTITDTAPVDVSADRQDSSTTYIYEGTIWHWGTDTFLYSSGRTFGSHTGFSGYIGNVGATTFELYNNATIIGSAISTDYSFIENKHLIDVAITTGKKCYFGIKNTSGAGRYIALAELLVEVE